MKKIQYRIYISIGLFIFILNSLYAAAEKKENWMNVYLMGDKIGYYHEIKDDWTYKGEPVTRLVSQMISKLKRFGLDFDVNQSVTVYLGKDLKPRYCQYKENMMGSQKTITAWVENGKMHIQTDLGGEISKQILDWDEKMQFDASITEVILREGLVTGKKYQFSIYSPELGQKFDVNATVGQPQRISAGGQWYETIPIQSDYTGMKELSSVVHVTKEGEVIKAEVGNYGMMMSKTTETDAKQFDQKVEVSDLSRVKSNVLFIDPESVTQLKVKVKVKEGLVKEIIPTDIRQKWLDSAEGSEGILLISSPPVNHSYNLTLPLNKLDDTVTKFTSSSLYIESQDKDIKETASRIAGTEKNSWEVCKKLSSWVYQSVDNKGFDTGFASAKQTFRDRKGDCTEHSVLLAALTRSLGIPTKIIVGLAAVEDGFYYHMWTEVYVGEWVALDPTFDESRVDAAHIKLAETKTKEDELGDYALQLLKTLKKLDLEIIEYTENGQLKKPDSNPSNQLSEYYKLLEQLLN